jgi:hypothetical protein
MKHVLDDWWESYRNAHPALLLSDQTYDQSHVLHALVTVVLFGPVGVLAGFLFGPWRIALSVGLACGIVGGLVGYLIREVGSGKTVIAGQVLVWDGLLDVMMPVTLGGIWACSALFGRVPWWTGPALYGLAGWMFWAYTLGRPGILHYDARKDVG